MNQKANKKVILGFSGGVDSTAACLLLQRQNYDVTGLYFDVLPGGPSQSAIEAENRAKELGIPFLYIDASNQFQTCVIDDFCRNYEEGKTPNPCVICNPLIKFRILLEAAEAQGAEHIATGHYAKVISIAEDGFCPQKEQYREEDVKNGCFPEKDPYQAGDTKDGFFPEKEPFGYPKIDGDSERNDKQFEFPYFQGINQNTTTDRNEFMELSPRFAVCRADCTAKDQSYMLYRLGQDVLSKLILPLGTVSSKEEVRELVRTAGIGNFAQKDSQDICFIPKTVGTAGEAGYLQFLKSQGISSVPGDFTDENGSLLGKHKGHVNYTVGQRKGLGMGFGKPMFVTKLLAETNRVVLGEEDKLFHREIRIRSIVLPEKYYRNPFTCQGKIRYAAKPAPCVCQMTESGNGTEWIVTFDEPQRAPTPGQSLVLYDGPVVLGGGIIAQAL